jgi:hypothetical protein
MVKQRNSDTLLNPFTGFEIFFLLLWLRRFERHDSLDFSELKNLRLFGF